MTYTQLKTNNGDYRASMPQLFEHLAVQQVESSAGAPICQQYAMTQMQILHYKCLLTLPCARQPTVCFLILKRGFSIHPIDPMWTAQIQIRF